MVTPLGAVVRGLIAGTVGTVAMDTLLYAEYRRGGGKSGVRRWEFSEDIKTWDDAPAPAQVGRRLFEGMFRHELPNSRAALVNNLTHWAFGILNGAAYGVVVGSVPKARIWYGVPFAATVWGTGYVVLPAAGLYSPIWDYSIKVLAKDLTAHLVYGLTTATAYKVLGSRDD
ncbi:DUF1440 domain-containing protein [Kribbella jiaozuonensis]|nr:DUF1440 domain-containing protein [Kribbella jiaozuonensis]